MAPQSDNQIKLRDGRRLGYAELCDPRGKPVLFFTAIQDHVGMGRRPDTPPSAWEFV